jgi:hypothetical protein
MITHYQEAMLSNDTGPLYPFPIQPLSIHLDHEPIMITLVAKREKRA